jgi:two-component system chemotaxis response regulator CheY
MRLRALIIDDSRVMRSMVMQSLQKSGLAEFEFVEAEDGADALSKFNPDDIHIAFVDWNMPNMTGVDFIRKVRALGNTEDIPMVMVTSEKSMGKVQEALDEAGADSYICKPFTVEEMQIKLKKVVDKAGVAMVRRLRLLREKNQQPAPAGGFFRSIFG